MNQLLVIVVVIIAAYYFYRFYKWNMKPVKWSSEEVTAILQSWIDGRDAERWEYFESCAISDSELEEIRKEALASTQLESQLITVVGSSMHLNEEGLKKFNELISRCNKLSLRASS